MPAAKHLDPLENPFGFALRRHRTRLGLTQEQLGRRLNYSGEQIGKFEKGDVTPSIEFARGCDEVFDTYGDMEQLAELAVHRAGFPSWFRRWPEEIEPEAHTLRSWQPLVIDGLLQTPEYARELLTMHPGLTEDRIGERTTARMERKKVLDRADPPMLWFVVDEDVLRSQVGNPKVMHDQLQAISEASYHTHVNVQVVPASVGRHIGHLGGFAIASMKGEPDVVYLESARAGRVSETPEDVQEIMNVWEAIRTEALSPRASRDLVSKVMEQWT